MSRGISTLGQVVGGNVRRLRKDQGATLEDLGRAVRGLGFNWSVSRINSIERGAREPKVGTLAVLAVALSCTLRDLMWTEDQDGYVDIGDVMVRASALPALFGAVTPALEPHPDRVMGDNEWLAYQGWSADALAAAVPESVLPDLARLRELVGRSGLVEERTAKILDLDVVELACWSWALWGRTLGEHRDSVAKAPHQRADVTGTLRAELADYINAAKS
jgi:transcriptional regulator with XRE-family HTH domain